MLTAFILNTYCIYFFLYIVDKKWLDANKSRKSIVLIGQLSRLEAICSKQTITLTMTAHLPLLVHIIHTSKIVWT